MTGVDTRPRPFGNVDESMRPGDGEVLTTRAVEFAEEIAGDLLGVAIRLR